MLIDIIRQQIEPELRSQGQDFVVAYSGGIDSHLLLRLMADILAGFPQHKLSAIHIHHGLSANADDWAEHCKAQCESLNVPFSVGYVNIERQNRQSLEAEARTVRYQTLEAMAPDGAVILLGQHADDQAETLLLQLKRGAGPKGLASMPVRRKAARHLYLRPLLSVTREEIVRQAQQLQLQWIEDESNQDSRFDRNFLRHQIMPLLQARWPGLLQSIGRSAELCAQQQNLVEEAAGEYLQRCRVADKQLSVSELKKLSGPWQTQVLRLWLNDNDITSPSAAQIQHICTDVLYSADDAEPCVSLAEWQCRRFANRLYLTQLKGEPPDGIQFWQGQAVWDLVVGKLSIRQVSAAQPDDYGQKLVAPDSDVAITFGGFSRRFKPLGQAQSKPLKQWFKIWGVPPWQRSRTPLLLVDDELVAVIGYAIAEGWQPQTQKAVLELNWEAGE